ncbi:VOC family protein [Halobacteria archaeon HArc-gm2]|nr:VOC family protein [Halobacteria archaeon HArc-gm2]
MIKLDHITFACTDPDRLAEFWGQVLDGERRDLPPSVDAVLLERDGDGPDLLFKPMPRGCERDLPIHLDLGTDDRETAVDELRELGASVRATKTETFDGHTNTWAVMEDPAGNGFCVTDY